VAGNEDSRALREASLQQAFDQAAEGLDLRLEPSAGGPARTVGIAFVCTPIVRYDILDSPPPIEREDDQQIQDIIRAWESLSTEELRASWRDYTADSYIGVAREGLVKVDQKIIDKWLGSDEYAQHQQSYPPFSPRRVNVSQIHIVYIARDHACATYRVTESFVNGKVLASNLATILAKLENGGWQIVVATKHGWEEQPQSP
jgi:hypothetical protein